MHDFKLRPPMPHHRLVHRPRLLRRLDTATGTLVVLSAPAGYGKTALLADWSRDLLARGDCAWLSLDAHDNRPDRLWGGILRALRQARPDLRLPEGTDGWTVDLWVEEMLPALLAALPGDRPLTLILDGAENVTDDEAAGSLGDFLVRLPAGLRVVLSTRYRPGAPVPALRVQGAVAEFDQMDLRFSREEAAALLADGLGASLPPDRVEELHAVTEGWAAGLCLTGRTLAGQGGEALPLLAPAGRVVADYLTTEVLDPLTAEQRRFLARSSVLDVLDVGACEAVTGNDHAGLLLRELARKVQFLVPVGAGRETYRLHGALRSVLTTFLSAEQPAGPAELHRTAARWYAGQGRTESAILQSALGGDIASATTTVLDRWEEPVATGRAADVARWLRILPSRTVSSDPRLCVVAAMAALSCGDLEEAQRRLDIVQGPARGADAFGPATTVIDAATVARAVAGCLRGDIQAADRLPDVGDPRDARELPTMWRALARVACGTALLWQGAYEEADHRLSEAVRDAYAAEHTLVLVRALGARAVCAALDGRQADARQLSEEAVRIAEAEGLSRHFVAALGHVCRGRLLIRSDALDEAEHSLMCAEEALAATTAAGGEPHARTLCQLSRAMLEDARRDADAARAAVRAAVDTAARCESPGVLGDLLIRAETRCSRTRPASGHVDAPAVRELSPTERRVLRALCGPLTLKEIASELYVSHNTVKTQVRAIFQKLDAHSRSSAIVQARERGLL
ncbi:helix-turn-helix transcriptional regulator [Actinoallomurus purpureus]|uniref:helix-turn-helix transcriptional regulator n=1 Tax=Actinoallomurus purpureus TaxID=478114 RepID=UPI002091FBB5|nr:LuxR C-terminal-related transcriptional regulator [Actinoallomurus purpureus]